MRAAALLRGRHSAAYRGLSARDHRPGVMPPAASRTSVNAAKAGGSKEFRAASL